MVKFKVKSRDASLYTWVYIYPTLAKMRKAANEYYKEVGHSPVGNYDALGLSHHFVKEKVDGNKTLIRPNVGIIRLAKNRLSTEIIAHELVHASMWHYRLLHGTENMVDGTSENADFGTGCGPREEDYAHIYGQMFRDITKKLYSKGLWS